MQTHAYAAPHATAYVSPFLWLLPTNIYPGSAGTVDGGLLSVFGLHSYQLVDALTACASPSVSALSICSSAVGFVDVPEHRVIGVLLVADNQSRFLISGFGFAQAARGTTLMLAAIFLFILAFTKRSTGIAVLAGGIIAVLAGVYMPAFLITLAAVLGAMVVVLAPLIRRSSSVPWRVSVPLSRAGSSSASRTSAGCFSTAGSMPGCCRLDTG